MSKHTSGPWTWYKLPADRDAEERMVLTASPKVKATPILIAGIFGSMPSDADARLIAMAPEMFSYLKSLLDSLGCIEGGVAAEERQNILNLLTKIAGTKDE